MSQFRKLFGAVVAAAFVGPAMAQQGGVPSSFKALDNVAVPFGDKSYAMSGIEVAVQGSRGEPINVRIVMPTVQWQSAKRGVDWLIGQRENGGKNIAVVGIRLGTTGMGHNVDSPATMFEDVMGVVGRQAIAFFNQGRLTGVFKDEGAFDLGIADRVFLVCGMMQTGSSTAQVVCTPNCVAAPMNDRVGGICPPGKALAPGRGLTDNRAFKFPVPTY